jgi:hypothetical protein
MNFIGCETLKNSMQSRMPGPEKLTLYKKNNIPNNVGSQHNIGGVSTIAENLAPQNSHDDRVISENLPPPGTKSPPGTRDEIDKPQAKLVSTLDV